MSSTKTVLVNNSICYLLFRTFRLPLVRAIASQPPETQFQRRKQCAAG